MSVNCKESFFSKKFYDNRIKGITDISVMKGFIQSFVSGLGCERGEEFCIEESDCNKSKSYKCNFYISGLSINRTVVGGETILELSATLVNSTPQVSYQWGYDESIFELVSPNLTGTTLQLKFKGAEADSALFTLTCISGDGCNDSIRQTLKTCGKCDSVTFDIEVPTDNICKDTKIVEISGVEYYETELTTTLECNGVSLLDKIISTRLEVVGVTTNYANGFIFESLTDTFKFRVKVSDASYFQNKSFKFIVGLNDCEEYEVNQIINGVEFPCCTGCSGTTLTFTKSDTKDCLSEDFTNGEAYLKLRYTLNLVCGGINKNAFITSVKVVGNVNVSTYVFPITSSVYEVWVEKDKFELFCSNTHVISVDFKVENNDVCETQTLTTPFDICEYSECCEECDKAIQGSVTLAGGGCFKEDSGVYNTYVDVDVKCGVESLKNNIVSATLQHNTTGIGLSLSNLDVDGTPLPKGRYRISTSDLVGYNEQLCLQQGSPAIPCLYYAIDDNGNVYSFDPITFNLLLVEQITIGNVTDPILGTLKICNVEKVIANTDEYVYTIVQVDSIGPAGDCSSPVTFVRRYDIVTTDINYYRVEYNGTGYIPGTFVGLTSTSADDLKATVVTIGQFVNTFTLTQSSATQYDATSLFTEYPIKVYGVFASKTAGDAYINSKLVSGTLTNSSFQNGLYTFETSAGAEVDNGFMGGLLVSGTSYEDLTGLITTYDTSAFESSIDSNIKLGSGLVFNESSFDGSTGSTIEIGSFDTSQNNNTFAIGAQNNTFNLKGTIGSTTGNNNIFDAGLAGLGNVINTIAANQTSNGGNVEGDLAFFIANGGTVIFNLPQPTPNISNKSKTDIAFKDGFLYYAYTDANSWVIDKINATTNLVVASIDTAIPDTEDFGKSMYIYNNELYVSYDSLNKFRRYNLSTLAYLGQTTGGFSNTVAIQDTSSNYNCGEQGEGPNPTEIYSRILLTYNDCINKTITLPLNATYCLEECCEECTPHTVVFTSEDYCVEDYVDDNGVERRMLNADITVTCPGDVNFQNNIASMKMTILGVDYTMVSLGGTLWTIMGLPKDATAFTNICSAGKTLKIQVTQCNGLFSYESLIQENWCDKLCEGLVCIDCNETSSTTIATMDFNNLCWFNYTSNLQRMRIMPYLNCNGTLHYNNLEVTVIGNTTPCSVTLVKDDGGQYYLEKIATCDMNGTGTITIQICWEKCN